MIAEADAARRACRVGPLGSRAVGSAVPRRSRGRSCIWPDLPDPAAIHYVLAWKPPAAAFAGLPNLKAIFSLGAGVDHIVDAKAAGCPDRAASSIPISTMRMTEWVVLQVLLHHRRHLAYAAQQAAHRWKELRQPVANAVRVGIMGFGGSRPGGGATCCHARLRGRRLEPDAEAGAGHRGVSRRDRADAVPQPHRHPRRACCR